MYICIPVYLYICICIGIYICMCMCILYIIYVCMYIYICTCVHLYMCICVYVYAVHRRAICICVRTIDADTHACDIRTHTRTRVLYLLCSKYFLRMSLKPKNQPQIQSQKCWELVSTCLSMYTYIIIYIYIHISCLYKYYIYIFLLIILFWMSGS